MYRKPKTRKPKTDMMIVRVTCNMWTSLEVKWPRSAGHMMLRKEILHN